MENPIHWLYSQTYAVVCCTNAVTVCLSSVVVDGLFSKRSRLLRLFADDARQCRCVLLNRNGAHRTPSNRIGKMRFIYLSLGQIIFAMAESANLRIMCRGARAPAITNGRMLGRSLSKKKRKKKYSRNFFSPCWSALSRKSHSFCIYFTLFLLLFGISHRCRRCRRRCASSNISAVRCVFLFIYAFLWVFLAMVGVRSSLKRNRMHNEKWSKHVRHGIKFHARKSPRIPDSCGNLW